MSIREQINTKPGLGIALAVIAVAVGALIYYFARTRPAAAGPTEAYYSADDGKTWFADDMSKVPPFEHEGGQAVRAHLYSCGGGAPFVGYLERYSDAQKQAITSAGENPRAGMPAVIAAQIASKSGGSLVKKPGTGQWVAATTEAGRTAAQVTCPDGGSADIKEVFPD